MISTEHVAQLRVLGAAELLQAWERIQRGDHRTRALRLLGVLAWSCDEETLIDLPLGALNELLFRAHVMNFGDTLDVYDRCPHCGEQVEFSLGIQHLLTPNAECQRRLRWQEWDVRFRALTTRDLLEAGAAADSRDETARRLARAGIVELKAGGDICPADRLPEAALEPLARAYVEADPLCEVNFEFACPKCDGVWESLLDIADFLCRQISSYARRLLMQIHTLATAYGWSEDRILALSPERRAAYLSLVGMGVSSPTMGRGGA